MPQAIAASTAIIKQGKSTLIRLLLWTSSALLALLVVLLAIFAWIAFIGISVDARRWHSSFESVLSERLGRSVRVDGDALIGLSMRPQLVLGKLVIAQPAGFTATMGNDEPMLTLSRATLALDIWPLLRERRLHVQSLTGSDMQLHLRRNADGRNNWTLPATVSAAPASPRAAEQLTLDLDMVRIERLLIDYDDGIGQPHYFDLRSLTGEARYGAPMKVNLQGAIEKTFPYELQIVGGTLRALQTSSDDFPFDAALSFVGSTIQLNGTLARKPDGLYGELNFGLGTPDLNEIERLLAKTLPKVGATALAGRVKLAPAQVSLSSLVGTIGATTLAGDLTIDTTGRRPRVSGTLTLPTLDMRPFLQQKADTAATKLTLSQWYLEIGKAGFLLDQLDTVDADLKLAVQSWLSLPGDVSEVQLQLKLNAGRLQAPVTAKVEGVVLSGELIADGGSIAPGIDLTLETRDSPLGGLAKLLFGLPTLRGQLGSFHLRAGAAGRKVSELVESLEVQIALARADLSYGNNSLASNTNTLASNAASNSAKRPVNFRLEWLTMGIPRGAPLHADTTATLLGQPLQAKLQAGTLPQMMLGSAPLQFSAQSRSASARIAATVDKTGAVSNIDFSVSAAHADDVANWLNLSGLDPQRSHNTALMLAGKARWSPAEWAVRDLMFALGNTRLDGEVAMRRNAPLRARIEIDTIDPKEFNGLLAKRNKAAAGNGMASDQSDGTARAAALTLDIPILPTGIDLNDSDLQIAIKRIKTQPIELSNVSFKAQVRNGKMLVSPFSATAFETVFAGAVSLDLRTREPAGELWLSAADVDVGRILRLLKLSQTIDAQASIVRLHAVARGSRLGDLLDRSELVGEIETGSVDIRDANTGGRLRLRLDRGELRADAGAPLSLTLAGALEDYPITLRLGSARLTDLLSTEQRLPFNLDATIIDHQLAIAGSLARPFSDRDIELSVALAGAQLQTLSGLARTALPSWGPYRVAGKLRLSRKGYELNDMNLRIGSSQLRGSGSFDTQQKPPRIALALNAETIQLNDFPFDEIAKPDAGKGEILQRAAQNRDHNATSTTSTGSPAAASGAAGASDAAATHSFDPEVLRRKAIKASDDAQRLFSPELLRRQNLAVTLLVDRVLSGNDRLGNGKLQAAIDDGRAQIGPIEVQVPGGSAKALLAYQPSRQGIDLEARLELERFDYGIIARRLRPDAKISGLFSLNLDVRSSAPALSQALRHGNGSLNFTVWPQSLQAGIFDLWAANLFIALANRADPSASSRINCGIGQFTLTDGVFKHKQLLIDTSRVRVLGAGQADMRAETVDLILRPQPKSAQFFSLATPISVTGPMVKPQIGTAPGAILETVLRLGTSLVWVPIQKLFGNEIAENGADVCGQTKVGGNVGGNVGANYGASVDTNVDNRSRSQLP